MRSTAAGVSRCIIRLSPTHWSCMGREGGKSLAVVISTARVATALQDTLQVSWGYKLEGGAPQYTLKDNAATRYGPRSGSRGYHASFPRRAHYLS